APEHLRDGELDLALIPVHGGETDDALFIHDAKHGILFVGDAFMPYIGAPFVSEGSTAGYLDALDTGIKLAPRRVIHGHPRRTALTTADAIPGLAVAARALYDRTVAAAEQARPVADVLQDNFVPASLRDAPLAVVPYLVMRDTFIERVYIER